MRTILTFHRSHICRDSSNRYIPASKVSSLIALSGRIRINTKTSGMHFHTTALSYNIHTCIRARNIENVSMKGTILEILRSFDLITITSTM